MSLLQNLYNGELYPAEQIYCSDPEYSTIQRKVENEMEYFKSKLSPDDGKRLERMEDLFLQLASMDHSANFVCSFKLGAKFMNEIFMEGDGTRLN